MVLSIFLPNTHNFLRILFYHKPWFGQKLAFRRFFIAFGIIPLSSDKKRPLSFPSFLCHFFFGLFSFIESSLPCTIIYPASSLSLLPPDQKLVSGASRPACISSSVNLWSSPSPSFIRLELVSRRQGASDQNHVTVISKSEPLTLLVAASHSLTPPKLNGITIYFSLGSASPCREAVLVASLSSPPEISKSPAT